MRPMTLEQQQAKALEAIEAATVAREWLDAMRATLIETLHQAEFDLARYKDACADAAASGIRVRKSDTLTEAMTTAVDQLVDFNREQGEWSS